MTRLSLPPGCVIALALVLGFGGCGSSPPGLAPEDLGLEFVDGPIDHVTGGPIPPFRVWVIDAFDRRATFLEGGTMTLDLLDPDGSVRSSGFATVPLSFGQATVVPSVSLPVADGYAVRARFQDASLASPAFDVVDAPDAVELRNPSSGQTGIVVDGVNNIVRVQDSIHITTATTTAVGVLRSETPSHDVAVFAPDRRPELVQASWTPEADTVSIMLRDPISLPVTVWVIAGTFADERAKMEAALTRVSQEWRRERMGLAIGDVEFMDATPQAPDFEIFALGLGAPFANLQNGVGRATGRFNIYVVAEIRENDGLSDGFAENFGTAIAVTSEAMAAGGAFVVAHEMGHNFGLRHPGAVEGFIGQANMMRSERNAFVLTEGQIFRAHFDRFTPLRSFRPGDQFPTRTCEAVDATTTCPALAFRVWSESDPAASRLGW